MSPTEFVYCILLKPRLLRKAANRLLRLIIPEKLKVRGALVHLNPMDPVVSGALRCGVYERDEIDFFCQSFKAGMTFVDVGANVGLYTALAIKKGAGRVLAVEPHPEAFVFLDRTIRSNHPSCRVYAEACAAGRENGRLTLYANPENKGDNRFYPDPLLEKYGDVAVESLDSLCRRHGFLKMDFLKIDVQGWEMAVMAGAENIFRNSPECIMMVEFWPHGLRRSGSDPDQYLRLLSADGRQVSILEKGRVVPVEVKELKRKTVGRQYQNLIVGPVLRRP